MNATESIAARADLVSAAGYFDHKSDEVVPSPCISVCRLSDDRSRCEGCFRTLDEIRAWSGADSTQRRAIWVQLLLRAGVALPAPLAPAPVHSEPPP
jgi:predicted Fe-S protein YdhL (DUF1289 family)